jgi:DNA (cytosine-5)-methyltransferase 1
MNEIRFVELFGGIGGFRAGLEPLGFKSVGYYEIDKNAVKTYNANWGGNHSPTDIRQVKAEDIPDHEVLTAGFPCQPFSVAGQRKGFADTRGTLFFEIARILEEKRPPYLFLENVRGLISHDKGRTFGTIIRKLDEMGYDCQWQVLNSRCWVPQNRERVFIIGHLRGVSRPEVFPFIEDAGEVQTDDGRENSSNCITSRYEGYSNPRDIERSKGCLVLDLQRPDPKNNIYNRIGIKDDGTSYALTTNGTNHQVIMQYRRTYFRENKKGECPTLTANMGTGGHNVPLVKVIGNVSPTGHHSGKVIDKNGISHTLRAEMHGHQPVIEDNARLRKLTPRECARLQGFSDAFVLPCADSQSYKQLGNAVSVPVIRAIGERLIKGINY